MADRSAAPKWIAQARDGGPRDLSLRLGPGAAANPGAPSRRGVATVLRCGALAILYFLAGKVGLSLAFVHASATAVWPPTGLAFAALLLLGCRLWPGVLAGAFLVNLITQGSVATSLGIAAGNTLEGLVGVWLVHRFAGGRDVFQSAPTIFRYVGLVAVLATSVSATLGVTSLVLGGYADWQSFGAIWLTWWLGDMVSALVVAPFLVVWSRPPYPRPLPTRVAEGACLLAATTLVSGIIFRGWFLDEASHYAVAFLCIPPLMWAAFRFRQHGAVACTVLIGAFALWATLHGSGPFVLRTPNHSLLLLQAFVGVVGTSMLVLGAVVSQQAAAQAAARASQERLRGIVARQRLQLAVSQILARATDPDEALSGVLRTICQSLDWVTATIWTVDRDAGVLRCRYIWHAPTLPLAHFEGVTRARTFGRGVGLPGRVWASGQPAWIPDVTRDDNFPRAEFAAKDGLHGGFAFPILIADQTVGVMEFFSLAIREPDEDLLDSLGSIGVHVGQFLERADTQRSLYESEARKAAVMDSALDCIISMDHLGRIIEFNPAAERTFNYARGEAVGRTVAELIIPERLRAAHRRGLEAFLAGGEGTVLGRRVEMTAVRKGGEEFPVELAITPVRAGDGPPWFTAYLRDISERKRVEAEVREYREGLEGLVNKRSAELEQARAAVHAAERLSALGTLSAGLGHDLANLLLPIRARIEALGREPLPPNARFDLEAISRALEHLSNLSAGMRLLAVDPERELASSPAADLERWWAEAEPAMRGILPPNVQLESGIPPGLGVTMPRHRLMQAVFNLVQNAGEALGRERPGVVRVRARPAPVAGRVLVHVQDDGPGMSAEVAARCFEPYFSTKGRSISTGMGLGLVKGLVEAAGGSIRLETRPGAGATFSLELPAFVAGENAAEAAAAADAPTVAVRIADPRLRTLVGLILQELKTRPAKPSQGAVPVSDVWVVESPPDAEVRTYLDGNPRGLVVVVMRGESVADSGPAGSCHGGRVRIVPAATEPAELRSALSQAVRGG